MNSVMNSRTSQFVWTALIAASLLGCQSGPRWAQVPTRLAWWKKGTPSEDNSLVARSAAPRSGVAGGSASAPFDQSDAPDADRRVHAAIGQLGRWGHSSTDDAVHVRSRNFNRDDRRRSYGHVSHDSHDDEFELSLPNDARRCAAERDARCPRSTAGDGCPNGSRTKRTVRSKCIQRGCGDCQAGRPGRGVLGRQPLRRNDFRGRSIRAAVGSGSGSSAGGPGRIRPSFCHTHFAGAGVARRVW